MTKFKKSVGYCPELEIHNFCETFPEKTAKNILPHRREDKMLFDMFYYALL